MEAAKQVRANASDHILDFGSGIGGPARYFANRFESRLKHHRALSVITYNNHIEPTVGKPLRVSLDDIARPAQPTPLHPQHGAHHHG